jgi:hypothetical protein
MEKIELSDLKLVEMTGKEMQETEGGSFLCILLAIMLVSATIALIGEIID